MARSAWRVRAFAVAEVVAVFAAMHVDYFAGSFTFAWWHGLTTALGPYGWLKEKTGGVAAGAVVYALIDVAALVV